MDMNRLTQRSQEAVQQAQSVALRFGHTEVDGEHLLLALLDQSEGLVRGCWRSSTSTSARCAAPSRLICSADRG